MGAIKGFHLLHRRAWEAEGSDAAGGFTSFRS